MTGATARRRTVTVATVLVVALAVVGGRYGFHRDELYFVEAGRHPAFGYPDTPPLVPLLATAWYIAVHGSLWAFRLVPALVAGGVVVVAALTCAALHHPQDSDHDDSGADVDGNLARGPDGAGSDPVWAAALTAPASTLVGIGHLFSTTTVDVLLTATTVLLLIRALDAAPGPAEGGARALRPWLPLGLVTGVALEVKTLPATVLLACAVGIVAVGPRPVLRTPGPYVAAVLALLVAAPNLVWQGQHGWPQLAMSRAIAAGSSGTSVDHWLVVPLQATLAGPVLTVAAVVGVVALLRAPGLRRHRWLAVAYVVLVVIVVATGGKPYYAMGLLPALLAGGAPSVRRWVTRAGHVGRRRWAAGLMAFQVVGTAFVALPVLPVRTFGASFLAAAFYDTGETVGWPALVRTVQSSVDALPADRRGATAVLARNYGEAGALAAARRAGAALPPVYSGHNGFADWGPPSLSATQVVVVGDYDAAQLAGWFTGCRVTATVDNGVGVDNDEQGVPIRVCSGLGRPWTTLWAQIRYLS